jgi:tetratricopeptide (TPR) repeat protein
VKKLITVIFVFFLALSSMACAETTDEWAVKGSNALENGNYDEAIRCYKQAIAKDPDNATAQYNLGLAYYKKGLNALAADYFYSTGLLLIKQGHEGHAFLAYEDLKKVESAQRNSLAPSSEIIKTKRLVDNLFNALQSDLKKKKGNPSQ